MLLEATALDTNSFRAALETRVRQDEGRDVLIFVPGFRVSFEEAAQRLGQISYDLGFAGAPILYSWPSAGEFADYDADEESAKWSDLHFLAFLHGLAQDREIKNIYIIAHSMGNKIVADSLEKIASEPNEDRPVIHDVIMAAPDINVANFNQVANAIRAGASRITIYESSNDKALLLSQTLHNYPRLGGTTPTPHVFLNYECIEASTVSTDFIGHSYFGDARSILSDIYYLVSDGLSADRRHGLVKHYMGTLPYWSFNP